MNLIVIILLGLTHLAFADPLVHQASLIDGLEHPARIAITGTQVLVTDPQANAIIRYDLAGNYLGAWSEPAGPLGIAVHPDGRIFVSRRDDARVAEYDAAFLFQRFVADGVVSFVTPTDLAMNPVSGRLYVVDSGADRFYGFDDGQTLALIVGMRGSLSSEFKYPSAIAVDTVNDRVLVADQENFRVQVFSKSGLFQFAFGYRIKYLPGGSSEGWLPRTAGLAVDATGRIYVTDALMSTLRVFDSLGAELGKVVDYGSNPGELYTPGGVALDAAGRVFIANSTSGAVEIFDELPVAAVAGSIFRGANESHFDRQRAGKSSGDTLPLAATALDSPRAAARQAGWDPPHMLDDLLCARCHDVDGQPGGHLGTVEGQTNLCLSCHTGAGQAFRTLIRPSQNLGMSHAWGVSAINPGYGSVGPMPGGELDAHLDGGVIKCATCHNQHNNDAATPFLRAAANAMCQECHADHVIHTPESSWQPSCVECHNAHDASDRNLSLVQASVFNQTLGIDQPVVFTATSGPNSFNDGDPALNDGICQVCHTDTAYHLFDGTGAVHNDGTDCTSCHPHDAGFMPAGGDCTSCHASPQDNGDGVPVGGRRAMVGEFPAGDAHAHYGAQLDSASCVICHDQATHMDGYVDLLDADGGNVYRFVQVEDLTADPDLSDFCSACHDSDGATRLPLPMDPFGNGNTPPNVATKFLGTLQWDEEYGDFCFGTEGMLRPVNSHHDISDTDQAFSGAKIECLDCHGAHNVSASQPLANPFDTTASWSGDGNGFCLACHAGGGGPLDPAFPQGVVGPVIDPTDPRWASLGMDWGTIQGGACLTNDCSSLRGIDSCDYVEGPWYVDYSWTHSAHGLDSKRGWAGYSGAPSYDMDCTSCHDPHGSNTPSNPEGNPYLIRDQIQGSVFVDDGTRTGGFSGPPWDTMGTDRAVVVPIVGIEVGWGNADGLCGACHATWLQAYDFHSFCNGCQTCHAHGAAFGEHDFVGDLDNTPCPIPAGARSLDEQTGTLLDEHQAQDKPLHQLSERTAPSAATQESGLARPKAIRE